jgi:opacity protein-like surface antigen
MSFQEAQMGRALAACCVLLYLCPVVLGQSNRIEIFGGYSLVTGDFTGISNDRNTHILNGWNASANFKANRWLGLDADFSGFYPSYTYAGLGGLTVKARSLSYLFGPQVSVPLPKIKPFVHFLVGGTHVGYPQPSGCPQPLCTSTSDNSFTFAVGGGVDFVLTKHLALRGQVDVLHSRFSTSDNQLTYRYHETNARISTGIVFRF